MYSVPYAQSNDIEILLSLRSTEYMGNFFVAPPVKTTAEPVIFTANEKNVIIKTSNMQIKTFEFLKKFIF